MNSHRVAAWSNVVPVASTPVKRLPVKLLAASLLAFVVLISLRVGPLVVMADEFPEDTNKIETLTPEQALSLFRNDRQNQKARWEEHYVVRLATPEGRLLLEKRTRDVDGVDVLCLNGLKHLTPETARVLALYKGHLMMNGLAALDAATAKALAAFKGDGLSLDGLAAIDAAVARALAETTWCAHLPKVKAIDADTAEVLAQVQCDVLFLDSLTALDADTAKSLTKFKGDAMYLRSLTMPDPNTVGALVGFEGMLSLSNEAQESFFQKTPLTSETALAWAAISNGQLPSITALDAPDSVAIAQALAGRKGPLALPHLKKLSPKTLSALIKKEDVEIPLVETLELIPEPDGSPTDDFVIPEWLESREQARKSTKPN